MRATSALHDDLVMGPQAPGADGQLFSLAIPDDCRALYVREPPGPSAFIRVANVVT